MIKRALSHISGSLLCLYVGYEAHLQEVLHPASRPLAVTMRNEHIVTLPPNDDTGAHSHRDGPPRMFTTIVTSTAVGKAFGSISLEPAQPRVRMWTLLSSGQFAVSEYTTA
jgi:hypothetical protein